MMMKTIFAAIAALSFAASAGAAPTTHSAGNSAGENPFARDTAVLQLQGLDLATADGQQRLAIRMDTAARAVCGDRLASVHLDLEEKARACRTEVVADIRSQIEARHAAATRASGVQVASAN
jgi:UrcA family protein